MDDSEYEEGRREPRYVDIRFIASEQRRRRRHQQPIWDVDAGSLLDGLLGLTSTGR